MKPLTTLACLFLAAHAAAQTPPAVQTLRIDPENAFGGTTAKLLADIEYLPLETGKHCLINRINQLEVTGKHFVILDEKADAVLIFDKTGKYLHTLAPMAKSPGWNQRAFYRFSVDHDREEIIVQSGIWALAPYVFAYDMQGKLLRKIKRQVEKGDETISLGNGRLLSNLQMPEERGAGVHELAIESEGKVEQLLRPIHPQTALKGNDRFLQGRFLYSCLGQTFFFRNYYSNELLELDAKGIRNTYRIILPASRSLPSNFLTDSAMEGKRMQYASDHPEKVFCFSNIFRAGSMLTFNLAFTGTEHKDRCLFYDLASGRLFSLNGIQADSSNAYLPVTGNIEGVMACDGGSFYSAVSSTDLYYHHRDHAALSPVYPPAIQKFFDANDRLANPVIIRFRFKPAM